MLGQAARLGVGLGAQAVNPRAAAFILPVRNHYNYQYKPGPYPKTPEERLAAAKKYNIHPDKYEPYPDDGTGYGDYPKLPLISTEGRSIYYPWDYPEYRRNFNEPLHVLEMDMNEVRYNFSRQNVIPLRKQWKMFFITIGGLIILFVIGEQMKMYPPVMEKQFPKKTNYTFDLE